ncbi:MAG: STAS domain-containing protein [Salinivirgaceae bacterium]|nr:STAS domain-containing protein [Salinivirgaceae bacterium]
MKDYSIDLNQNKKEKSSNVTIHGQLNITNISDIKKGLEKALKSKKIDITLDNIDDMDVSFLQLIKAYKTKCKANNIELNISSTLNDDLNLLIIRAGLQNIV